MSDIAIRCEGLSKQYRIGERESYKALREVITDVAAAPFRRLRSAVCNGNGSSLRNPKSEIRDSPDGSSIRNSQSETGNSFWAVDDVSFEVKRGEVVGIIGRNGAGKSTLLKILSRITKPTRGHAEIHGRVGSLLEVGTGFHPELTGRENIYLNGAILGMRKSDIDRKFDEIVVFADVEKFIDTPVKRFSSGMYVRLAFAVAAHLETEILLLDEVLAVGDGAFQKKCLGKMADATREGRTVLFVSHNMESVARLCPQALLLERGKIENSGNTADVIAMYLHSGSGLLAEKTWSNLKTAPGNDLVRLNLVRTRNGGGESQQIFDSRQPIGIEIGYTALKPVSNLAAEFVLYDGNGNLLFTSANQYDDRFLAPHELGQHLSTCWIPENLMTEGTFFIRVSIVELQVPVKIHVFEENILVFQVVDNMDGNSARGRIAHNYPGLIRPRLTWSKTFLGDADSSQDRIRSAFRQEPQNASSEISELVSNLNPDLSRSKDVRDLVSGAGQSIPLFKVHLPASVLEPLAATLLGGYVGQGPRVDEFEQALAPWFGSQNVLAMNSGTSALQLALRLANVGFGDDVVSTPMTCTATNVPIMAMGAKIVWADIDPTTGNIDPLDVERKITKKTKAIMAVHWGGYPSDIDELNRIGKKYNVAIIEDAAHAFGATYQGQPIGSHSDFVCFSFQAIKHLTTVDGGALICRDTEAYKRGKLLRWYGIDRESERKDFRCEEDGKEWGYKFHMNDIAATIGLHQLQFVGDVLRRHRENGAYYRERFKALKGLTLLNYRLDRESSYWLFTVRVRERQRFMEEMKKSGIVVSQVHARNDLHTMFTEFQRNLPGLSEFVAEHVSIPVGWWLTEEQRKYIADTVISFCN